MEENKTANTPDPEKTISPLLGMFYCEVVAVALLLAGLMAVKLFFPDCFTKIQKAYTQNFLTETSLEQVLDALPDESVKNP